MNKFSFFAWSIILILPYVLSSCLKTSEPEPLPALKIGLLGGLGGFSDAGFNQNMLAGYQRAAKDFPIICQAYDCKTSEDISKGIKLYLSYGFDLIITSTFDAAQATIDAAYANPGTDFILIDYAVVSPPPNLMCVVFDVDQSSFPCGFLAAYWAYSQNNSYPVAGFVAGPEIPEILQFSVSYSNGIDYFNKKYSKNVAVLGYHASSFSDTLQGARLADSLIRQNASIIFAFAGKTGNGALYKVKDAGKCAIGVDVDQYFSIPQVGPVLLTSCMKELDIMVYGLLKGYYYQYFQGGTVIHGNLNDNAVGMAPFHNYDALIPDTIKSALVGITTGIKNGTIKTGWPQ